jgi:GMP synthase (glutamine-hydrolysing)
MNSTIVLRHVPFEDLGAFTSVLEGRSSALNIYDVGVVDMWTLDPIKPDLLVVLGGPIGVYEEETYPFLLDETAFIARRIEADRPTLGVCLGAQLIAKATGARVYPNGMKEIGLAPITLTEAGRTSCLAPFVDDPVALHWHGDTFDLPRRATLLASTNACTNQAFALGSNIIGFQFHPEAGGPGFERWLIGHAVELSAAGIDIPLLRADASHYGASLARKAEIVLTTWLDGLVAAKRQN